MCRGFSPDGTTIALETAGVRRWPQTGAVIGYWKSPIPARKIECEMPLSAVISSWPSMWILQDC
jgi:hypothetical protein